jgi:cytochrome c oxidase subunit 3/cytochrome o ubiquinol oxidase subunit 3
MLSLVLIFLFFGSVKQEHDERIGVLALYWHFVDTVWVIVLSVVYFIAR